MQGRVGPRWVLDEIHAMTSWHGIIPTLLALCEGNHRSGLPSQRASDAKIWWFSVVFLFCMWYWPTLSTWYEKKMLRRHSDRLNVSLVDTAWNTVFLYSTSSIRMQTTDNDLWNPARLNLSRFYPAALKGSGVLSYPERAGGRAAGQTSPVNTLTSIIFHGSFSNLARTFIALRSRTSSIMEVLPH